MSASLVGSEMCIRDRLCKPAAPRREVRTLAGGLSYFAGLAPRLRPFVKPLWAAFSAALDAARLPASMVHVKRMAPALR
eukprot:1192750-Alexandrium_andersonii.AAC.1